jgi:hypothetical protein
VNTGHHSLCVDQGAKQNTPQFWLLLHVLRMLLRREAFRQAEAGSLPAAATH